jgi:hypothetical protein
LLKHKLTSKAPVSKATAAAVITIFHNYTLGGMGSSIRSFLQLEDFGYDANVQALVLGGRKSMLRRQSWVPMTDNTDDEFDRLR